jgi:hypothetical protein
VEDVVVAVKTGEEGGDGVDMVDVSLSEDAPAVAATAAAAAEPTTESSEGDDASDSAIVDEATGQCSASAAPEAEVYVKVSPEVMTEAAADVEATEGAVEVAPEPVAE